MFDSADVVREAIFSITDRHGSIVRCLMIVEQYVHTLIPQDAQFCPKAEQVSRFVKGLTNLGAAPLDST